MIINHQKEEGLYIIEKNPITGSKTCQKGGNDIMKYKRNTEPTETKKKTERRTKGTNKKWVSVS